MVESKEDWLQKDVLVRNGSPRLSPSDEAKNDSYRSSNGNANDNAIDSFGF